ncbi:MAG: NAD(P)/FAD-dependent oxidoreductase, partial [Flavobacteriaceae bacterium]
VRWAWYFKKSSTHTKVARSIPLIRDINVLSRELYMDLRDSGELGTFHLERIGLLMLFQTQKSGDHEMKTAKKAEGLGLEVSYLDRAGLQQLEPDVEIDSLGAIHYECDAHSTPPEVMARFKEYLPQRGVAIHSGEAVLDMTLENGRITKLITDKGAYQPDEVVLAAGSWTAQLSQKMGISLPLQAGKGYRINVHEKTGIRMPAILMEPKMAVTPMNGFTRFAGTMEFSGINDTIRQERVNAIARGAERFYKGLRIPQEAKAEAQCGLRPVSPDGLPYIGRSQKVGNLVFATGHAMMGYSLGPATGLLVSQLISEQPLAMDLSPFSPDRKF